MSDGDPALEEALILHQRGEFEAAQRVLRQHLEIDPTSADGLHLMALCEHDEPKRYGTRMAREGDCAAAGRSGVFVKCGYDCVWLR